jgi:23S rRNA-/tRNA-specific pseudouridylate synthase
LAGALGQGQFVAIVVAHEAKILGQNHQLRTHMGGLRDPVAGLRQIGVHIRARNELNRRHLHKGLLIKKALFAPVG